MQTVEPLAARLRQPIVEEPLFSEETFAKRSKLAQGRLADFASHVEPVVLCTHRPVLPSVLAGLASEYGLKARNPHLRPDLDPGGFVVLHRELDARGRLTGRVVATERYDEF